MVTRPLRSLVAAATAASVLAVVGPPAPAVAAPGGLDHSFSGDGRATTSFLKDDYANAVVAQPNGTLVVAGYGRTDPTIKVALARYRADGSLDPTFGTNGKRTDTWGGPSGATRMVRVSGGKLLVGGWVDRGSGWDFAIARYRADGTRDTTFSGDGLLVVDLGSTVDFLNGLAVDSQGRIVAVGITDVGSSTQNLDVAVLRFLSDGTPDAAFGGGDGRIVTPVGAADDYAAAVGVRDGDALVVAGSFDNGPAGYDGVLLGYTAAGDPDPGFSGDGRVDITAGTSHDWLDAVAIQSDGRIVAAGRTDVGGSDDDFLVARVAGDGTLDADFDGDGIATVSFSGNDDVVQGIAIQTDGRIVVAGHSEFASHDQFAIARLEPDGSPDTTFSGDGATRFSVLGSNDIGYNVAIQRDGRIVMVGTARNGAAYDMAVVRLATDPLHSVVDTPADGSSTPAINFPSVVGSARGGGLASVQIGVNKVDAALLNQHHKCRWVTNTMGNLVVAPATKVNGAWRCVTPAGWIAATGRATWSVGWTDPLPQGTYAIRSRAVGATAKETAFSAARGNLATVTLT